MTTSEKEILQRLLVGEEDVTKSLERLVSKAENFIQIEKGTGKVLLRNVARLSHADRIALLLVGRYFAQRLGLVDSEFMHLKEISSELGTPRTSLSGPLKRLVMNGVVQKKGVGEYAIVYYKIERVLDEILSKARKMTEGGEIEQS